MPEQITRDDVKHVARLARLTLTEAELDEFTGQLAAILGHAQDVAALDLADVPQTSHPLALVNVMRPDVVAGLSDRAEILAAAPSTEDGQFRVPPVLGESL
jgi:aspartyl-tRNA(Asn)/glutamyl-tRNA(Gln) amidotransferase subunit C